MKRLSMITLFVALFTFAAQAQENTYNMVIEMTNGTKITIGPNDIRSLTFNNGELTVTGGDLQTWMESVPKRVEIDALLEGIENLRSNELLDLETLKEYFGIDSYWGAGKKVSEALVNRLLLYEGWLNMHDEWLNNHEEHLIPLEQAMKDLPNEINVIKVDIANLMNMINNLEDRITKLEAQ